MIANREATKIIIDQYNQFGDAMPDGRLTEKSSEKKYRLREAIIASKQLGRPLTEDEMKKYEV